MLSYFICVLHVLSFENDIHNHCTSDVMTKAETQFHAAVLFGFYQVYQLLNNALVYGRRAFERKEIDRDVQENGFSFQHETSPCKT